MKIDCHLVLPVEEVLILAVHTFKYWNIIIHPWLLSHPVIFLYIYITITICY